MGGNALKNVITIRKNLKDYVILKNNILSILDKYVICKSTIEIPEKLDFGDLDIIYIQDKNINMKELIIKLFSPKEIVMNGDVISFDYENFQIDLIKCENKESLIMYDFYLSYGDLGSIIGRIANYYGLKFGHAGLWMNLLENTIDNKSDVNFQTTITRIDLTNNPNEICEFMDLDYNLWKIGFSNKKGIMDFIIKSKYFLPEIFNNLNYDHRDRAKLRPFYKEFLEYIKIDFNSIQKASLTKSEIGINYQKEAIICFNKEKELEEIVNKIKINKIRKEKFNGKHLIELGINPKNINKIIQEFKIHIENKIKINFDEFLDNNEHEFIINYFKEFSLSE